MANLRGIFYTPFHGAKMFLTWFTKHISVSCAAKLEKMCVWSDANFAAAFPSLAKPIFRLEIRDSQNLAKLGEGCTWGGVEVVFLVELKIWKESKVFYGKRGGCRHNGP